MAAGFGPVPAESRFVIARATVPACLVDTDTPPASRDDLVSVDIEIADTKIAAVTPSGRSDPALPRMDLDGGMAWPCFVDMHTHLDKGHIWPRQTNPDGTFEGALHSVMADRERNWSAEDVRRRMDFALRCAYAHGTRAIRTHLDTYPGQTPVTWGVFAETRQEWSGRIELQGACLSAIDKTLDDAVFDDMVSAVRANNGILGTVSFMVPELQRGLDRLFKAAIDYDLDLDFHVDESQNSMARSLRAIAETALKFGFERQITVGHCCSLARQPEDEALETLDRVAKAGIAVVSLPMCNLYLQDRQPGRTPRRRGVTLLHEMRDRGIDVAVASDNTRDPFYAYGDLDALEVFREATRIIHLDHPFGDWPRSITATPAHIMKCDDAGMLSPGSPADLVLFRGRTWTELLSRPQSDRIVMRSGKAIDTTLPDYRELDPILERDAP